MNKVAQFLDEILEKPEGTTYKVWHKTLWRIYTFTMAIPMVVFLSCVMGFSIWTLLLSVGFLVTLETLYYKAVDQKLRDMAVAKLKASSLNPTADATVTTAKVIVVEPKSKPKPEPTPLWPKVTVLSRPVGWPAPVSDPAQDDDREDWYEDEDENGSIAKVG